MEVKECSFQSKGKQLIGNDGGEIMKTILWFAGLVVIAWLLTSCEEAGGVTSDENDDTNVYFDDGDDVELDESPPPDDGSSTDTAGQDVLSAEQACAPYLGWWYCSCKSGSCYGEAFVLKFRIEATQMEDSLWILSLQEVDDDLWGLFTCDPTDLPPTNPVESLFIQIIDPTHSMEIVAVKDSMGGLTLACTR